MAESERASGCLLGQCAGDALGSLVEFQTPAQILRDYPDGVRELADGGQWDTLAGQPTDDSELALTLARSLVEHRRYDPQAVFAGYVEWLDSEPFDCGQTIGAALRGAPDPNSQANGALMRISPLGIFGAHHPPETVMEWARADAALTHPHPACGDASAVFAAGIGCAIRSGDPGETLGEMRRLARGTRVADLTGDAPPEDFLTKQGWVRIAYGNALWQLAHADSLEAGVVDTVMRGGDTDTNAAIAGALLGAVHGAGAIPAQWSDAVLGCRPGGRQPRPDRYWPVDALSLAQQLLENHS